MKKKIKKNKIEESVNGYDKIHVKDLFDIYLKINEKNLSKIEMFVDYQEKGKQLVDDWIKINKKKEKDYFEHLILDSLKFYINDNETKTRTNKKVSN